MVFKDQNRLINVFEWMQVLVREPRRVQTGTADADPPGVAGSHHLRQWRQHRRGHQRCVQTALVANASLRQM